MELTRDLQPCGVQFFIGLSGSYRAGGDAFANE